MTHAVDDVEVRNDVTTFVNDHPGSHAVDSSQSFAESVFTATGNGLVTVDVYDCWSSCLDRLDDRRVS